MVAGSNPASGATSNLNQLTSIDNPKFADYYLKILFLFYQIWIKS
ncbi:hypothetical protein [Campylobacter fetus]|uniref:Uncharacterized protein n=1 Tax=Campylobacter fetus subsp. fetus (strain 82-40) TaxID=360106 RepID=A0RMH7_CAMFF|nr:hypothetical protein CFF8240_0206 [Campylobacter fetus subsp. fetus 82-40]